MRASTGRSRRTLPIIALVAACAALPAAPAPTPALAEPTAELTGAVYSDRYDPHDPAQTTNGVRDPGEPGLGGVPVTLVAADPTTRITTTSDATGAFRFTGLPAGTYRLEVDASRYRPARATAGDAGGDATPGAVDGVVLADGDRASGYAFGQVGGVLDGAVYRDDNNNGQREYPAEPGVASTSLVLSGAAHAVATTNPDGYFLFRDLPSGSYAVTERQPPDYADGVDTPGTAGGAAVPPDTLAGIVLGAGATSRYNGFGERGDAVGGVVFHDDDADGVPDQDEARAPGVGVLLSGVDGSEQRTVTDPSGGYLFVGVPAGDYTLVEEQPEGYGSSTPNQVNLTVTAGRGATRDFGDLLGSASGVVWLDADRDGEHDRGEPGAPGVRVDLVGAGSTTTGPDGGYLFDGLAVGEHELVITPPDGTVLVSGAFDQGSRSTTVPVLDTGAASGARVTGLDAGLADTAPAPGGPVIAPSDAPASTMVVPMPTASDPQAGGGLLPDLGDLAWTGLRWGALLPVAVALLGLGLVGYGVTGLRRGRRRA
ncbi:MULTISPECIES: SdrD B-like domain-containing protein [Actinosynnema]|uniref:SdrD B-like domain-containing protein n=1 Tax=Actinosynnema TaxID=40566 RepID=UPI0026469BA7|nr:SdrD B-like domain-containing protein [Actinosynnema pretiosum]MCP2092256.1 Cna protein B-type domain-containing protein [Actinosynnema pretiosum]